MIRKCKYYLRQVLPLMQNSWIPAAFLLIFGCVHLFFNPLPFYLQNILHFLFFIINIASIVTLGIYNRNRSLFLVVIMLLSYMAINYQKYTYGVIYYLTPAYLNMIFLIIAGLIFFYFLPNRPFFSIDTLSFLIVIFAAFALCEWLSALQIKMDFSPFIEFETGLQIFSISLFVASILIMLLHSSVNNKILSTYNAYTAINIMLALYLSNQSSGLSLFFVSASATTLCGIVGQHIFTIYKDPTTGIFNGKAFIKHTGKMNNKYGLGIIYIDDYKHLLQAFRKSGANDVVKMISKRIKSIEPGGILYRCTPNEFVIIFPNIEKRTAFKRLDDIRRQIAASEFILPKIKRPLKITVSCCIAVRKREEKVANLYMRALKKLQKASRFSQNITSEAS